MLSMKPATWVFLGAMVLSAADASAVGPGNLGQLDNQSFSIGNSFGTSSSPSFLDIYTFNISSNSYTAGTTITLNFDVPFLPGTEFELSNMTLTLLDTTANGNALLAVDTQANPGDNTLLVSAFLAPGTGYQLVVAGDVNGTMGGSYGGVLQALPVPESETWAMMLVGLGLVGLRLRKKDRNEARLVS